MDPRVRVTAAALAEQLRLALEIWNAMADAQALAHRARALGDQLRALATRSLSGDARTAVASLEQAADSLAASAVADDLGALLTVVESADRAPTAQSRDALAELRTRLARDRTRFAQLAAREMTALNARLAREGAPPVQAAEQPVTHLAVPAAHARRP
jgi:hypothetical protein